MTIAYDLKLDADGDIYIDPVTMDFVIAPSDQRHIEDILQTVPGWIKEFPLMGWNPYSRINAKENKQDNIKTATTMLLSDGYVKGPGGIDFELTPDGVFKIISLDVYRP